MKWETVESQEFHSTKLKCLLASGNNYLQMLVISLATNVTSVDNIVTLLHLRPSDRSISGFRLTEEDQSDVT